MNQLRAAIRTIEERLVCEVVAAIETKEIVALRKHQEMEAVLDADHLHVAWSGRYAFN